MKKVGIIGCGIISQVHCSVLAESENTILTAVCDLDEEKARKTVQSYLQIKEGFDIEVYTDWHEMCGADIDAVHICTPHFLHVPMAVELLDAGKAVFMEKPCAISREQFEMLKEADKRHPGKLGICFQNRYNETTLMIDKVIAEGSIGRVIGGRAFVTWRRDEEYYKDSPWKGHLATEGGGALINQSIHTLDLLLRYLGEPETVRATVSNHHLGEVFGIDCREKSCEADHQGTATEAESGPEDSGYDIEDTVEAWMEFKNGARACFYASTGYAADAPVILEIQGDKGRISMNGSMIILEDKDGPRLLEAEPRGRGCGVKNTGKDETQEQGYGTKNPGKDDGQEQECRPGSSGKHAFKFKDYWGWGHKAAIEEFYRCLESGKVFPINLESVENTFNTMMRIYDFRNDK